MGLGRPFEPSLTEISSLSGTGSVNQPGVNVMELTLTHIRSEMRLTSAATGARRN